MNIFSKIERSLRIRPVFKRTLSYLFILLFIITYFAAKMLKYRVLNDLLSFSTSSAIFWMIIIFIALGHMDFFRNIIKDLIRSKISEFSTSSYFKESVTQLLNDEEFRRGVNDIIGKSSENIQSKIPLDQRKLDTGNKLED